MGNSVLLQRLFQEQQPRGLLGVVKLGGTATLFPEYVVNVFERLLEHGHLFLLSYCHGR